MVAKTIRVGCKEASKVRLDKRKMRTLVGEKFLSVFPAKAGTTRCQRDVVHTLDRGRPSDLSKVNMNYQQAAWQKAYFEFGDFVIFMLTRKTNRTHKDKWHGHPPTGGNYHFSFEGNDSDKYVALGQASGPSDKKMKFVLCGRLEKDFPDRSFTCFGELKPLLNDDAIPYYTTDGSNKHTWRFEMVDVDPQNCPNNIKDFLSKLFDDTYPVQNEDGASS